MTWDDIVDQAFVDLQVTQVGESITSAMRTDAQTRLNALLGSLSTEGLMAFNQVAGNWPLTSGISAYTLGVGGTLNTSARAMKATAWRAYYSNLMSRGGPVLPLDQFGAQIQQNSGEQASVPRIVGADTAYPLINVRVSPPPSSTPGYIEITYWTPITQITSFSATVSMPDGWTHMLHYNLAVALAPQYARQGGITPELAANAQNSKASLVAQNTMGNAQQQQSAQ